MTDPTVEEAARAIEMLTGIPPGGRVIGEKTPTSKKERQAARLKRFIALPPELQEGALRYAEQIQKAYRLDKS